MKLIFSSAPKVTVATNTFINVPVVLKYEDTPLLEVINEQGIGFTTQIPIFHSDGTYLAKVKGNRVFPTEEGKKANITVKDLEGNYICSLDNKVLFELTHGVGDAFKADAELYAPDGYFIKCSDVPKPELVNVNGKAIQVGGMIMSGNMIMGCSVGIWLRKDGSCAMGCS